MPVPLLLENPVVMNARGSLHVLEFMQKLSEATGCYLLLDLGHLLSHQLARGLGLLEGFEKFPWERVAQLHLAGGVVTGKTYADDHPQPIRDETWALFEDLKPRCKSLRAVTYEGDGHPEPVARRVLERLRKSVGKEGSPLTPALSPTVGERETRLTGAWELFDEVHRTPSPELDYRLAVLAEHLDAEVPLSRACAAPTRDQLARFTASTIFRDWFVKGTRSLGDAFVNWAMVEARRPELAGAEALISLEVWSRNAFSRARRTDTPHLDLSFAVDLTEALHASRALKRHLGARGILDGEGWDGLLQCARRAPRTPWPVRLTAEGARVIINPIS